MADSAEVARDLVGRFYDQMWNRFDVSALRSIASADVRFRGSLGDETVGHEQLAGYVERIRVAFPDFHNTVVALVAEPGVAFARLRYTGTHLGPLGGAPPTGRHVAYDGAALFHVRGGVITDVWVLGDRIGLETQLGLRAPE